MSLFHNRNSSINFQKPDEGGDGLREMIKDEQSDGFDIFSQETGEELEAYLNNALAIGGVALGDSRDEEF